MIKWRNKIIKNYKICPMTGQIFDEKTGEIQELYTVPTNAYLRFNGMPVHQIMMHTYSIWGYVKGWDVHHKNENILDNKILNLDYISHEHHAGITHKDIQYKMPKEKYDKWINNLSESHKGHVPCNKGQYYSEKIKQNMRLSQQGFHWYNNGIINVRTKEKMGGEWIKGRIKHVKIC